MYPVFISIDAMFLSFPIFVIYKAYKVDPFLSIAKLTVLKFLV